MLRRNAVRALASVGPLRFGRRLATRPPLDTRPDWQQADPAWVQRALRHSQHLPGGGWYVLDALRRFGEGPRRMQVDGRDLVVWRGRNAWHAAPDACPHMGASLAEGRVQQGCLECPWHGLILDPEKPRPSGFRTYPTHDDGVLLWVQLPTTGETPSSAPYLPPRPRVFLDGVIRLDAQCHPRDVIQNRLDPWHGTHYHPHAFASLRVIEQGAHEITVRVAYRVLGPVVMEVDARFHCPSPRCIVMTVTAGDGRDSVVETHATPLSADRTAIVEATLATSDRRGFAQTLHLARLLRPLIQRRAARLWVEDARYAERLHARRAGISPPASGATHALPEAARVRD